MLSNHRHEHSLPSDADSRYLVAALTLLAAFMITEIITAVISVSLALLSDAGHMLSDIGAIAIALWAARLTRRRTQGSWTWGWKRAEIMSAAVNGVTLLVVAILVGIEAVRRLVTPPAVGGPGHCHSRPHPDRPICPNRPVPTPHHPIPPLAPSLCSGALIGLAIAH